MAATSKDHRGHFKKRSVTAEERREIARKNGCELGGVVLAKCLYCGAEGKIHWVVQPRGPGWVQFQNLEIEHIHPEFFGGGGGENLSLACRPCNRSKGSKTLLQWRGH